MGGMEKLFTKDLSISRHASSNAYDIDRKCISTAYLHCLD